MTSRVQYSTLCALTHSSGKGRKMLALSHHIYNALSDTWIKCSSKQQPFIKVTAHVSADDYAVLGHDTALTPRSAMAWQTQAVKVVWLVQVSSNV